MAIGPYPLSIGAFSWFSLLSIGAMDLGPPSETPLQGGLME